MTCNDVQGVLPEVIDGGPNGELQEHLKSCSECSSLVADLQLIASEASQLESIEEPPARLWVKIAAELRAEGIIREPNAAPMRPVPVSDWKRRWNAWWLVPVAAAVIAAGAYMMRPAPAPQVANQTTGTQSVIATPAKQETAQTTNPKKTEDKTARQVASGRSSKDVETVDPNAHAPFSMVSNDAGILNRMGQGPSSMRSTFEGQMKAVNAYIRDAEAYVRANPDDEEARQQLMDAYEQKAMLYQMALDNVQ